MQLKPLSEQVVVIFGASSGIGREAALRFAQRGAKLVLAARGAEGLDSLVNEIAVAGGTAVAVPADTSEFGQVQAVAERAATTFGRLDTWVHLAATSLYATFEQITPSEFKQVIDVTLTGQAYGAMAALPHLRRAGGGALIHVSSVLAKRSVPYQSAYCAAKHGIDGFLESLRVELQREGVPISVTNVMPASINTPFFSTARTKLGVKPQGIPPIYDPSMAADAILYAAEHPVRDIAVGGAAQLLIIGQRISPQLMDSLVLRYGFEGQKSDEPKSVEAPNNLFQPVDQDQRIRGDFTAQAKEFSLYTWLETHPVARIAVAGLVAGAARLLARSLQEA